MTRSTPARFPHSRALFSPSCILRESDKFPSNSAGWARHVASPLPHTAKRLASSSLHGGHVFTPPLPPELKKNHRHLVWKPRSGRHAVVIPVLAHGTYMAAHAAHCEWDGPVNPLEKTKTKKSHQTVSPLGSGKRFDVCIASLLANSPQCRTPGYLARRCPHSRRCMSHPPPVSQHQAAPPHQGEGTGSKVLATLQKILGKVAVC